jgi:hypothetical protein
MEGGMTEQNDPASKSLNDRLAAIVAKRLSEKGLISDARLKDVISILAAGTATEDDWRAWIEFRRPNPDGGGDIATN